MTIHDFDLGANDSTFALLKIMSDDVAFLGQWQEIGLHLMMRHGDLAPLSDLCFCFPW
jgi:hypothetical protein